MKNGIYNMDCFDAFPDISEKSIDMILCDLPYGCLNRKRSHSKCDIQLPLDKLWKEYKRIIKDNGAIILFGSGMFTADLMKSNPKWWRYNLIWKKGDRTTGFLNARRMPLRNHVTYVFFIKGFLHTIHRWKNANFTNEIIQEATCSHREHKTVMEIIRKFHLL